MTQPVHTSTSTPSTTSTSSTAPAPVLTPEPTSTPQHRFFHALEASGRFRRDTPLGGILHRGKLSLREVARSDSLHVIIDGNRMSAHVDKVCPLDCGAHERTRYSLVRVVAHNLSDVVSSAVRRLRGLHGRNHCQLECEMVWVDDEPVLECVTTEATEPDPVTR